MTLSIFVCKDTAVRKILSADLLHYRKQQRLLRKMALLQAREVLVDLDNTKSCFLFGFATLWSKQSNWIQIALPALQPLPFSYSMTNALQVPSTELPLLRLSTQLHSLQNGFNVANSFTLPIMILASAFVSRNKLACDFFSSHLQKIIAKQFPLDGVICVFVVFGGFVGAWAKQMRKCTNSCSRLIDLLNKI